MPRIDATPAPQPTLQQSQQIAQATKEFEAIFLVELLKTARQASDPLAESGEAAGSENYREFAERFLADALAKNEAFGLGRLLRQELEQRSG